MSVSVTTDHVKAAMPRIASRVRRTPVLALSEGAFGHSGPVSLKLELLQHAGSFKARGAFHSLLSTTLPPVGVTTASGGNHGAAVAYAARELGTKACVFVPDIASRPKVAMIRGFGAEIVIGGARYADAQRVCDDFAKASGAFLVHPYDTVETISGQGTLAMEWSEQAELDTVLVAVGGGGLVAGMAAFWNRSVKVIGVEPRGSRALHAALEAGKPVDVEVESIAADSLGARRTGDLVLPIAQAAVDRVVLVEDSAIVDAQRLLWRSFRIAAEPGGSAALAALLSRAYVPAAGERVGILVCGGNVDLEKLAASA